MSERKIKKVTFIPVLTPITDGISCKRKVAAYARVSTGSEEQETSLEAQRDYYENFIKQNHAWQFVDVYFDDGLSGLSFRNRDGFNRMIAEALDGKIDLIITKSLSRFARNTVDTLVTIRKLKAAGIEVYFEKEDIHTLDAKGEFLITLMSSLAQEESRSISENVAWGQRKRFSDGKYCMPYVHFLGYDRGTDGFPAINNKQEPVIRLMYRLWLLGETACAICQFLKYHNIPTLAGLDYWSPSTVTSILTNEKYKGDALLQKEFTVDFLTKRKKKNEGELPQYYVKGGHEAIIPPTLFDMTQEEFKRRRTFGRKYSCVAALSSKVICGVCGGSYGIKVAHPNEKYRSVFWKCSNFYDGGTHSPSIQDRIIRSTLHKMFKKRISKRPHILANCSLLLSQICENDIGSDFIRKFLSKTQTLWTDEWLLRTLVDRIIVQPDGAPKIYLIDSSVPRG